MVDDILNTNKDFFDDYIKKEYDKLNREANLTDENIL